MLTGLAVTNGLSRLLLRHWLLEVPAQNICCHFENFALKATRKIHNFQGASLVSLNNDYTRETCVLSEKDLEVSNRKRPFWVWFKL